MIWTGFLKLEIFHVGFLQCSIFQKTSTWSDSVEKDKPCMLKYFVSNTYPTYFFQYIIASLWKIIWMVNYRSNYWMLCIASFTEVLRTILLWGGGMGVQVTCILCFCQYPSAEIPKYEVFSHPSWELNHFFWKVLKIFA